MAATSPLLRRAALIAVMSGALASGACASLVTPAPSALIQADQLTVSGRHALPRAEGALAGRLEVGEVVVDPALARQMALEPEAYRALLTSALQKSLGNYGSRAPARAGAALRLRVEATALELSPDKQGTSAVARLRISPMEAGSPGCLTREARADFRALAPTRSGGGQRAFGMVAGVTMAILGGPAGAASAGTWMANQMSLASADNAALNARRGGAFGDGVAPTFDRKLEARFAGVNATQLAIADYVAHLGQPGACQL